MGGTKAVWKTCCGGEREINNNSWLMWCISTFSSSSFSLESTQFLGFFLLGSSIWYQVLFYYLFSCSKRAKSIQKMCHSKMCPRKRILQIMKMTLSQNSKPQFFNLAMREMTAQKWTPQSLSLTKNIKQQVYHCLDLIHCFVVLHTNGAKGLSAGLL